MLNGIEISEKAKNRIKEIYGELIIQDINEKIEKASSENKKQIEGLNENIIEKIEMLDALGNSIIYEIEKIDKRNKDKLEGLEEKLEGIEEKLEGIEEIDKNNKVRQEKLKEFIELQVVNGKEREEERYKESKKCIDEEINIIKQKNNEIKELNLEIDENNKVRQEKLKEFIELQIANAKEAQEERYKELKKDMDEEIKKAKKLNYILMGQGGAILFSVIYMIFR